MYKKKKKNWASKFWRPGSVELFAPLGSGPDVYKSTKFQNSFVSYTMRNFNLSDTVTVKSLPPIDVSVKYQWLRKLASCKRPQGRQQNHIFFTDDNFVDLWTGVILVFTLLESVKMKYNQVCNRYYCVILCWIIIQFKWKKNVTYFLFKTFRVWDQLSSYSGPLWFVI